MRPPAGCDVAVIGGGVIGAAIAARVASTSASVCLLERERDLCEGASKGNAGVTVCALAAPGTLEAKLVADSHPRWEEICERLEVPFARVGALIVALDGEERDELEEVARLARQAGASGARTLSREQALRIEPALNPDLHGAVLLPDEGIIDSLRLVFAYAELAARNGARIVRDCEIVGFERSGGALLGVHWARGAVGGRIAVRFVINAAGIAVGELSALAGGDPLPARPRQGQYLVLDGEWPGRPSRILIPVRGPAAQTRGVQVIPTTAGNTLVGPTAQDTLDPHDTATDARHMALLLEHGRRLVPALDGALAIKSFAANRVVVGEDSLLLRRDGELENLIHASNRAIGLSCAPAIAEEVLALMGEAGLRASERSDALTRLPRRPRLRRVVCPCMRVGEREVRAALRGPVPALSPDGVRKRTGAASGRCQGALCMHEIMRLCSEEVGVGQ